MAQSLKVAGAGLGGGLVQNAWLDVPAATTDAVLVAAVAGRKVRVLSVLVNAVDAGAVTFTFNSKGAGAGTAISPTFKCPVNGGFVLTQSEGWFETIAGEALTITTASASAVAVIISYEGGS